MTTFTTKYSIGDKVFYAGTNTVQKRHPCPDCLGTKEWEAVSPAGDKFKLPCPRCSTHYMSNDRLSLRYTAHIGYLKSLTIGSIQTDTERNEVHYMAHETGIGSGSVHRESSLFTTEEAAQEAADALASERNADNGWIAERYNESLEMSDYQFTNAEIKSVRDLHTSRQVKVQMIFEDIADCEALEEIRKVIEDFDWNK